MSVGKLPYYIIATLDNYKNWYFKFFFFFLSDFDMFAFFILNTLKSALPNIFKITSNQSISHYESNEVWIMMDFKIWLKFVFKLLWAKKFGECKQ